MQVVIQVIRKTFVFMFLLFFFLEVIYMVFLTLLYRVPLSKNRENIIEALNKNAEEITNSFTELIQRKYNQVQTELLLFKQHMNFMYNTLNTTTKHNSIKFNKCSAFFNSYGNCVRDKDCVPDNDCVHDNNCVYDKDSDIISKLKEYHEAGFIKKLLEAKHIDFLLQSREEIIKELLNNDDGTNVNLLNKIFVLSSGNSEDKADPKLICYAVSYLKSQVIKNILLEQTNQTILNYTFFYGDSIYTYPPRYITVESIKTMPFYDLSNSICNSEYSLECFSFYHYDAYKIPGFTTNNTIFYPGGVEVRDRSLLTNICINMKLDVTNANERNKFLCATYNVSQTISNAQIDSREVVYDIVVDDGESISLLFSSNNQIYSAYNKFSSDAYGQFKLNSTNDQLSLFHSLYFDIEMNKNLSDTQIKELVNEYKEIYQDIYAVIANTSDGALFEPYNTTIYKKQTYLEYIYNTKGEKDYVNGDIKQEDHMYYIQRVLTKNNKYMEDPLTFDEDSDSILIYVILKMKLINPIKTSDIYDIYFLKIFRSWVFFLGLLFFGSIFYFILIQYIMTCLLIPIKYFKRKITNLIEKQYITTEIPTSTKINSNTSQSYLSKVSSSENGIDASTKEKNVVKYGTMFTKEDFIFEEYTNNEIKEIEGVVIFLKKILLLNNTDTPFQRKAEFYQSIAAEIPKDLELDLFKCQIIVGSCYLKVKQYSKAKEELENLQKRIEQKQNELISKYEINEQKNRNLSSLYGTYINEYSQDKITIDKKWISLMFISENCHYLLALANYYQFFSLYRKTKQNKDLVNITNAKLKLDISIAQRQQKDYYLENAINHFKAAYKINEHLQINLIKNIIILVYLSKCFFHERRSKDDSNKMMKKAIVSFAKFNKLIKEVTSKPNCKVDPRIMLIVNGNIMEYIVYNIAKFAKKSEKYKITYIAMQHFFHLSYYKNENLHCKALKALSRVNEILKSKKEDNNNPKRKSKNLIKINSFELQSRFIKKSSIDHLKIELRKYISLYKKENNLTEYNKTMNTVNDILSSLENIKYDSTKSVKKIEFTNIIDDYLSEYQKYHKLSVILHSPLSIKPEEKVYDRIDKFYTRLSKAKSIETQKAIIIIISDTFAYNFNALKSFGILLVNSINKFIDDDDLIGYIYFANNKVELSIPLEEKSTVMNQIIEQLNNIKQNEQCDRESSMITNAFDAAIDMFIDKTSTKYDKYIFSFAQHKDIRYPNKESTKFQMNKLNYMKISLYFFCFNYNRGSEDKEKQEKFNEHYRKFFRKLVEGYLIFVENFKMIKLGFANITYRGRQKNLFSSNLDNVNNIV